jgi:flagellar basal-body rod modification protein FlgD
MVTAIPNTAATASTASTTSASSNASRTTLTNNYQTFLQLLTTQLKNQDPLSPMDSAKFTEQLVQYSGVEQQIKTNDLLTSLTDLTKSSTGGTAVSYLGKTVEVATSSAALGATGSTTWNYNLPRDATSTNLKVVNADGRTVANITGQTTNGNHVATWDGRDLSGVRAPAGGYRLVVESVGSNGSAIAATVSQSGLVDSVDMTGKEAMLSIRGLNVPLSLVTKIRT